MKKPIETVNTKQIRLLGFKCTKSDAIFEYFYLKMTHPYYGETDVRIVFDHSCLLISIYTGIDFITGSNVVFCGKLKNKDELISQLERCELNFIK